MNERNFQGNHRSSTGCSMCCTICRHAAAQQSTGHCPCSFRPDGFLRAKNGVSGSGVYAVNAGNAVFVSWRSLEEDPAGCAFNLYRTTEGTTTKLNASPITGGTNYTDTTADQTKDNTYFVKMVTGGTETATDGSFTLKEGGAIHFVWVGDFNGDGAYDYLVDRYADDHQKLEAWRQRLYLRLSAEETGRRRRQAICPVTISWMQWIFAY